MKSVTILPPENFPVDIQFVIETRLFRKPRVYTLVGEDFTNHDHGHVYLSHNVREVSDLVELFGILGNNEVKDVITGFLKDKERLPFAL